MINNMRGMDFSNTDISIDKTGFLNDDWHFLSNKDYPPKLGNYLCLLNFYYQVELKYIEENGIKFWLDKYSGQPINIVIAWKYIEEDY